MRLGYDEINHAAFLFSTFYPDSLYLPMRAYSAVAQAVAPNINVDSPEMTAMIELFKQRGTVIDPTLNLWMRATSSAGTPNVTGLPAVAPDSVAQEFSDFQDAARQRPPSFERLLAALHQ